MSGAIDPYKRVWDESSENPFTVTMSSGSAVLSSGFVIQKYPEAWKEFKEWTEEKKISEPLGEKNERVVLLYSAETSGFKEEVAQYIATKNNFFVLTAPFIYEKQTGNRIAFSPYPKEGLNDFIKRMIYESQFVVILYTEQGGQIIETSWCSDSLKPTLGLVQFYRGSLNGNENEVCKFLGSHTQNYDTLFWCNCRGGQEYKGKVGGYICSDAKIFCPFTQQKITKMIFDFYIMNPRMHLFGAVNRPTLQKPIDDFFNSNGFQRTLT